MFNFGAQQKGMHGANRKVNNKIANMYGMKITEGDGLFESEDRYGGHGKPGDKDLGVKVDENYMAQIQDAGA